MGLPHLRGLSQVFWGVETSWTSFFSRWTSSGGSVFLFSFLFGLIRFFWGWKLDMLKFSGWAGQAIYLGWRSSYLLGLTSCVHQGNMLFGRIVGLITIYLDFWTSLGLPERPLPSRPCTRTATRGFVHDYRRFNATKKPQDVCSRSKLEILNHCWLWSIWQLQELSSICSDVSSICNWFSHLYLQCRGRCTPVLISNI